MTKPETEWVIVPREPTPEMLTAMVPLDYEGGRFFSIPHVEAYRRMLVASPPAPSVPDVVREIVELHRQWNARGESWSDTLKAGEAMYKHLDRMAAALTAQAKTIEGLTEECQIWRDKEGVARGEAIEAECQGRDLAAAIGVLQIQVADRADIVGERDRLNSELALAEATVTELRAEIERRRLLANEDHETIAAQAAEVGRLTGEVERERTKFQGMLKAEHELSDAYIRLRVILGAMNPPSTMPTTELWSYVEGCAASLTASLETARAALEPMQAVVDAAQCIQHWHDTNYNPATGETEGMVVSAEHVKKLWSALAALPSPPITKIKGEG